MLERNRPKPRPPSDQRFRWLIGELKQQTQGMSQAHLIRRTKAYQDLRRMASVGEVLAALRRSGSPKLPLNILLTDFNYKDRS